MKAGIDRTSLLPFYFQLKERLVADIEERGLVPGDRLPGDHDLCRAYGVSRTVVRQALAELKAQGIVERIKGRGTFVAQPKTAEGLVQSLTGLFEDVAARGGHLRSDVLRLEELPADEHVAMDLGLEPGSPIVLMERLRYVDEVPWVLTLTHIPARLAPGLVDEDLSDQSLYALLEGKYGVDLVWGRRSVEAMVASKGLAASLGVVRGAPVLALRSLSFGVNDVPVESFVAYHRGDRSRFEVVLTRMRTRQTPPRPLMHVTR